MINFCFQALVEKGFVKMQSFSQGKSKLHYIRGLIKSTIRLLGAINQYVPNSTKPLLKYLDHPGRFDTNLLACNG